MPLIFTFCDKWWVLIFVYHFKSCIKHVFSVKKEEASRRHCCPRFHHLRKFIKSLKKYKKKFAWSKFFSDLLLSDGPLLILLYAW